MTIVIISVQIADRPNLVEMLFVKIVQEKGRKISKNMELY